eukprot:COSAG05_NODE_20389_length_280_cov_0.513812_1_plen_47_part_10
MGVQADESRGKPAAENEEALRKAAFFKQKTAYWMESRDWSSDVCSSD